MQTKKWAVANDDGPEKQSSEHSRLTQPNRERPGCTCNDTENDGDCQGGPTKLDFFAAAQELMVKARNAPRGDNR